MGLFADAQAKRYVVEMQKNQMNPIPNLERLLFYQEGWQTHVFCYDY